MPIVSAKCPNCGGELQLDDNLKTGFCMFCGSKIVIQEAIELKKVQVEGKVTVEGIAGLERMIHNGEQFLELGEYEKAYNVFTKISNEYPEDHRGWWGLIICATNDLTILSKHSDTIGWYQNMIKLAKEDDLSPLKKRYEEYLCKAIIASLNRQIEVCQIEIKELERQKGDSETEVNRDVAAATGQRNREIEEARKNNSIKAGGIVCIVIGALCLTGIPAALSGYAEAIPAIFLGAILILPSALSISAKSKRIREAISKAEQRYSDNIRILQSNKETRIAGLDARIKGQQQQIQSYSIGIHEVESYTGLGQENIVNTYYDEFITKATRSV